MWDLVSIGWKLLTSTTGTLMWIGALMVIFYFGGTISKFLEKISVPLAEWFGKAAPVGLDWLVEGVKGLSSLTVKSIAVLALLGFGIYTSTKWKCDCQAQVKAEVQSLREDYQFVKRTAAQKKQVQQSAPSRWWFDGLF